MARKEKKEGLPTMGLVSIALLALFILGAGSSVIWNKTQIHALGLQIRSYEARFEVARGQRRTLERVYETVCSHGYLEDRVRRLKLDLAAPQPDQMVRLREAPPQAVGEDKLMAARKGTLAEGGAN